MHISKYFSLNIENGHKEIDFIDIHLNKDTKLFLDPLLIEGSEDEWCEDCNVIINSFFKNVFSCIELNDKDELKRLLSFGHEPNETRLGLSRHKPRGKGTSSEGLINVFEDISNRNLFDHGMIEHSMDLCVFVRDFAEDRMSDLVTNILRKKLNEFTVSQCNLHGIELSKEAINIGKAWNPRTNQWENVKEKTLLVEDSIVLLVPKEVCRKSYVYSIGKYLSGKVIEYRQEYHFKNDTGLVQTKYNKKKGKYKAPPTKQMIREKEIKGIQSKLYVEKHTKEKPKLIREFRQEMRMKAKKGNFTLKDERLDDIVYGKDNKVK